MDTTTKGEEPKKSPFFEDVPREIAIQGARRQKAQIEAPVGALGGGPESSTGVARLRPGQERCHIAKSRRSPFFEDVPHEIAIQGARQQKTQIGGTTFCVELGHIFIENVSHSLTKREGHGSGVPTIIFIKN